MDYNQFKLFKQITLDYFSKLDPQGEQPSLNEHYLEFGEHPFLDYTSMVKITGEYSGCVYLTAPQSMIVNLLRLNNETEINEHTQVDMARELSNVLAGNASAAFGANWKISVPQSYFREDADRLSLPSSSFIMPFNWKSDTAYIAVSLEEKSND